MAGIYIHIPFCRSKCPYCDFYSVIPSGEKEKDSYTEALIKDILSFPNNETADTVYFGGGTPSLLGAERIGKILSAVREKFILTDPEITVECNPSSCTPELFTGLSEIGVNRISLGMQSAVDAERRALGRTAGRSTVKSAVEDARRAGINNISVDLMLGIPYQTKESLLASIMFIKQLDVSHVSAYMLKIEEGTVFYKRQSTLSLPSEDDVCDMYLYLCRQMEALGYRQYEISNFAKPGYKSRHNLKYWHGEEYISFGPSAHSFYNGKRYYCPGDIGRYLEKPVSVPDGDGGGKEEYVMLALRLTEGLDTKKYEERFGKLSDEFYSLTEKYRKLGLMKKSGTAYSITTEGFLISNTIIGELIYNL